MKPQLHIWNTLKPMQIFHKTKISYLDENEAANRMRVDIY